MTIIDYSTPSLFRLDGFQASIHRYQTKSERINLDVGASHSTTIPSLVGWHTGEVNYLYLDKNTSKVQVSDALLDYTYYGVLDSTVYEYSYWRPYNTTVTITNISGESISLTITSQTDLFKLLEGTATGEGYDFALDQAAFDKMQYFYYLSMEVTAPFSLNAYTMCAPSWAIAEYLNRTTTSPDEYYTVGIEYGTYMVSLDVQYMWKVMLDDVYGNWRLRSAPPALEHDVAITSLDPCRTVIDQNCLTSISVKVSNQGHHTETFNIAIYANSTPVETKPLTVQSGKQTSLVYTWNTTGLQKGNWTLLAAAEPVAGETDLEDNNATCYIQMSIKGDVDANGKVNIIDISKAATAFATTPGEPKWSANADVNEDQKINIIDISTIAKEFGKVA